MTVTTPALAAAFRLATSLPRREHKWSPHPGPDRGGHPGMELALRRRDQIRQWLAERRSVDFMVAQLQISDVAVYRHIRIIRAQTPHHHERTAHENRRT